MAPSPQYFAGNPTTKNVRLPTQRCREPAYNRGSGVIRLNTNFSLLARKGFRPNSLAGVAFGIGCVAAAAAIRWFLGLTFGNTLQFVPFFPAVILTALFAGAWPAMLALTLSVLVAWFMFVTPYGFGALSSAQIANVMVYVVSGAFVIWLGQLFRSVVRDLQAEQAQREMILDEVQHRARNMGAMGAAIVQFSLKDNKEAAALINSRMRTLQATNDLITKSPDLQPDIETIIRQELAPYDIARCTLTGAPAPLPSNAARAVALVVHELITNAVKYGALSPSGGSLDLSWSMQDGMLEIDWQEDGGPKISAPTRSGFGTKLIDATVASLNGSVEREFRQTGLRCRVRLRP
jgi:two-component sensor histidine kinase